MMYHTKKRNVSTRGLIDFSGIKLESLSGVAAKIIGDKVALQHVFKEMSVVKGINTLSRLNQKDSFDYPGCTWPDPKFLSEHGVFCENGARAIFQEATNIV